jgi:hypothetical protein
MNDREWFDLVYSNPKEAVIVAAQGIVHGKDFFGTYRLEQAVIAYEKSIKSQREIDKD